jgi:TonB family protein
VTPFLALWLVLSVAPAPVAAAETDVTTDPAACPPPVRGLPRYPVDAMRANLSGTTLVLARIDGCGRVVESRIHTPSGHPQMDEAAHLAVKGWVLSPEERARIGGEWVKLPVKFGGVSTYSPKNVDWPDSHRRPRYLPDESPIGYDSVAAFHEANRYKPGEHLRSPYGMDFRSGTATTFNEDVDDPAVFWLSYGTMRKGQTFREGTVAIARYRLVQEQGEPVVRVALLCELEPGPCEELREFLLKGLPIARARRN